MAFTKTPIQSTEQTKTVPLMFDWASRNPDGTKDADAVNVVWDIVPNQGTGDGYIEAVKREGLVRWNQPDLPSGARGVWYWEEGTRVLVAGGFGVRCYFVNGTLAWSNNTVLFSLSGVRIGFTNFLFDDGSSQAVITDGTNLATYTVAGAATVVTDPDRPNPHRPYPVFLDGYLFLADVNGNIWNSDNNVPSSWSASNFISSEAYADTIVALARHSVYIVAFGTTSIEFFYDAANPTGTPLAKYSASTPRTGYKGGLAAYGDTIYFVGNPVNGNPTLCKLDGVKVQELGTSTSDRAMETIRTFVSVDFPGHILAINGHVLWTWSGNMTNFGGDTRPGEPSWMYDVKTQMWSKIETSIPIPFLTGQSFPAMYSTFIGIPTVTEESKTLVLFYELDVVYAFTRTAYQDNGINFNVSFTTKKYNFGTNRMKFGSRMVMWADQTSSSSLMNLSWSDDDYQTFSTPRSVDLNSKYQHLHALGSFRERAFRVTYSDNFPMRWQSIELDYDQGSA